MMLALTMLALCFSGCRPPGILHSWEMREILCDLHKTDAAMQFAGISQAQSEARMIYYSQVLERHGTTQAEFDSSLVWYTAHPQLFDKIYPRVMKELKAQQEAFENEHHDELSVFKTGMTEVATVSRGISRAELDSVLWVTQHGYRSSWTNEESYRSAPSRGPYPLLKGY